MFRVNNLVHLSVRGCNTLAKPNKDMKPLKWKGCDTQIEVADWCNCYTYSVEIVNIVHNGYNYVIFYREV